MGKVVDMTGCPADIRVPGTADPNVVEALERLLEMARSGEINSVCAVYAYHDGATNGFLHGYITYSLVGRLEDIKMGMVEKLR